MPGLVGQFPVSAFTDPQSGQQKNVSVIRGNDNTVGAAITGHDASATIHVQSSTLASRPAAGTAQRFWVSTDGKRLYLDNGTTWDEIAYVTRVGGAGNLPYGAVPGTPADGDVWVTASGFFVRVAGVTIGPMAAGTLTLNTLAKGNASGGFQDSGVTDDGSIVSIPARTLTVGAQPRCYMINGATITIVASSSAPVTFSTEVIDVGAMHSTATNTERITIPTGGAGTYEFIATGYTDTAPNNDMQVYFNKNNALVSGTQFSLGNASVDGDTRPIVVRLLSEAVAADYFHLTIINNSAGSRAGGTWTLSAVKVA